MGRVEGKIAIITGAASGIGLASAKLLTREGAKVLLTDRDVAGGERAAAEIGATFQPLDVSREDQWIATIDFAIAQFGRLDILVNNAGVGVMKDIESTTLEEWRFVHAVNTEGVFLGCREGIRVMKRNQTGGSIINVSSIAGLVGDAALPAYCSSKAAVRLLSKSVALHCAQSGYRIRCNSVHPSFIATAMVDKMIAGAPDHEKMRMRLEKAAPLGHMGEPDDVAAMILYLASDESKFVTGTEMVVDGGATAR
jgi:3(or 17)beta-hydroxysteroid dehydrogenase